MRRGNAFTLTLLWTLLYLGAIVGLPLLAFGSSLFDVGLSRLWVLATEARVSSALWVSFSCSAAAAALASVLGLIIAWVLDRYQFRLKRVLDLCVDLPLALPTAVSGLALCAMFSPAGPLGRALSTLGLPVAYTRLGIAVALLFTALPAVIRTLQPVLDGLDREQEEAAACLGAGPGESFRRIVLPQLMGGLASGFLLAFARALSEYGSVAFISGNLPLRTETVPVLVLARVEQGDLAAAIAVAAAHLALAALVLGSLGWVQDRASRIGAGR